jgi:hypothetical protein
MEPVWLERVTRFSHFLRSEDPDGLERLSSRDIVLVLETQGGTEYCLPLSVAALTKLSEALAMMLQAPDSPLEQEAPEPSKRH